MDAARYVGECPKWPFSHRLTNNLQPNQIKKGEINEFQNWPSRLIPTAIHFFSRQYWHRLRLMRRMEHCWFLVHGRYWIFCWMLRRKKPCNTNRNKLVKKLNELDRKPDILRGCLIDIVLVINRVERIKEGGGITRAHHSWRNQHLRSYPCVQQTNVCGRALVSGRRTLVNAACALAGRRPTTEIESGCGPAVRPSGLLMTNHI